MERTLLYWKQILAVLAVVGFIWFQHSTIKDLRKDNAQLELKLKISNTSIETLQIKLDYQNTKFQELETAQKIKQSDTDAHILKLQQENKDLQGQVQDVMNTPETGNECNDIQSLLQSVGD